MPDPTSARGGNGLGARQQLRLRRVRVLVWIIFALGGGIALWGRYQELSRATPPGSPQLGRAVTPGAPIPATYSPAPEVRFLLAQRAELRLTDAQAAAIGRLQEQWHSESQEPRRAAASAARAAKGASGPRARPDQIRSVAEPVAQLSEELAARRRAYWDRARALLTRDQQARLQPLLAKVTLADLLPEPSAAAEKGVR
ncbi:MAG TPA: Spy/CpxP family protein refolding chaperone [Armatimonadota bacterium]|jgi:hypothetical protein